MTVDVDRIAEVVLYEGYLLYPYRPSSLKNQQRWTFGGVYPEEYSRVTGGFDPWVMQTQCIVTGGEDAHLEATVRFLQVVDRTVMARADGEIVPVPELRVGGQVYRPWEEAVEREVVLGPVGLRELAGASRRVPIEIGAGSEEEPLQDGGDTVGALVRTWQAIRGYVDLSVERVEVPGSDAPAFRVTVRIANTTPGPWRDGGSAERQRVLRQTPVSTHTILRVHGGELVSLLEPPEEYQAAVQACENIGTWPVLAGEQGERHTILSSPIILYDYPQIAPESPGNYFDTTEIDELLALSVLTLTDEEKQEMRESDPRGREILERTEALTPEQLLGLHGAVRELRMVRREEP